MIIDSIAYCIDCDCYHSDCTCDYEFVRNIGVIDT